MDFGVVGFVGLVGSHANTATSSSSTTTIRSGFASLAAAGLDSDTKNKWYGSGLFKQERSTTNEDDCRSSKLSKIESMVLPYRSSTLLKSNAATTTTTTTLFTDNDHPQQQQMLSFSSPKSEPQNSSLPYFHLTSSGAYNRNTGYLNYGNFNSASMHGVYTEAGGPFTPSQWMELEHQALIYKYITANVPVPSNLLIPIKKALDSAACSSFSGGLLRPNALSWGAFHLGFSNNTDPEPGRCRRTDGKKWRCSRDAVADQKYCERHMNRGRHRSRKPVEGQYGHSAATGAATATAKPTSTASSSTPSLSASVVDLRGSSGIAQHQQLQNLQPDNSFHLSAVTPLSRMFVNKEKVSERLQDSPGLSMLSSNIDLKSKENSFLISKETSQIEFGLVNFDSLLNPSQNRSSISCQNFGYSQV